MRVLITHTGDATKRWAEAIAPGLAELGTQVAPVFLPISLPRRPTRLARALRLREGVLRRIRSERPDAVILGPGGGLLQRPFLLNQLLESAQRIGAPVIVRWGDCRWILQRTLAGTRPTRIARSLALFRERDVTNLAMTQFEGAGIQELLGLRVTEPIGNVRGWTAIQRDGGQSPLPEDPPLVVNVASIQPRKGTDLFTDVARTVRRERPEIRFVWVGGLGPDPDWSRRLVSNHSDAVEFVGHQSDPSAWVQRSSLMLMTSRSEAASGAVLEAMSLERTVVAFDKTGTPELLGLTGAIVPNGDVSAATSAVLEVIDRPAAERVNRSARERYKAEFSPSPAARRLQVILDAVVTGDA